MDAESRKEAAQAAILAAVNDDSRSNAIIIVTSVFFAISFVSVCLRLFVRTRVVRAFGWDDTTMMLAMVGPSSIRDRDVLCRPTDRIVYDENLHLHHLSLGLQSGIRSLWYRWSEERDRTEAGLL